MKCSTCGDNRADHFTDPDGCEGGACMSGSEGARCRRYEAVEKTPAEAAREKASTNKTVTGADHPDTSHEAAALTLPNSGTQKRSVYDLIAASKTRGMTDDELESALNKSHQSVSARRNDLAGEKLIYDSGKRRRTKTGHPATVWLVAPLDGSPIQQEFDFDEDDMEDEGAPEFDARIVILASFLAGRIAADMAKRDSWGLMKLAKEAMAELGLNPGEAPEKPLVEAAAAA